MESTQEKHPHHNYGLPRAPNRSRHPDLNQLLDARGPNGERAPIFVKNVMRPMMTYSFVYRNPGEATGRAFTLPSTEAPFPLHLHLSPDQIRSATSLLAVVAAGKVITFWPDEVNFTPADQEEIKQALAYAKNPNQEGYSKDGNDPDVEIPEDPNMLAMAEATKQRNPRVVVLMNHFEKKTMPPGMIFRELISLGPNLSDHDFKVILGSLTTGQEIEAKIRAWVTGRLQYLALHPRQTGQVGSVAAQNAMKSFAQKQARQPGAPAVTGKRGRVVPLSAEDLRGTGSVTE